MNMELRKELRDFINWQRHLNLLKDPLTIDYELAETYLESKEKQFSLQGVGCSSCECKQHSIKTSYGFEKCTKCGNEWDVKQ